MIIVTFLDAVATINVPTASNNDQKFVELELYILHFASNDD